MTTVTINSTSQDGYIVLSGGGPISVVTAGNDILVDGSSSTYSSGDWGYFFFNSAAVIPANAIVDAASIQWKINARIDDGLGVMEFDYFVGFHNDATLDLADWDVISSSGGFNFFSDRAFALGTYSKSIPTTSVNLNSGVNSGYTNVEIAANIDSGFVSTSQIKIDSVDKVGGFPPALVVTYHLPGSSSNLPIMGA